ncbi:hypothetical protein [Pseudomonas simiae]|jgi:hypothetical protein|uniref:Uncharacterized protein n=1 Tax=Pseudomonas simiae TaxID=321846 RepID=A0A1N7UER8_9PSED|nr:hypothetical protein [Pseudomonas simiae]AIB35473.1 hypothetical protein PS417_07755 [Pseudomonas simiae]
MPKPSDIELKRNQLARLKANLDECGYRLAEPLAVENPHTSILRANALSQRLSLGMLISKGEETRAGLIKQLAQLPAVHDIHAFQETPAVALRVGKIAKTDEQEYVELVAEFTSALAELNQLEVAQGEEVSTPDTISSRIESAPRIGRPAKTPLENLDRGLAENYGIARLALAKAVINEETPRKMGRPARSMKEVSAEYDKRKAELDQSISNLEAVLQGVEVHDRAAKIYRDALAQFKRLVKELGGVDQIEARAEVNRLEAHLKFLKSDRKRYIELGEPDLPLEHHNSPRHHLLSAKAELAAVRDVYDQLTLPREIKRMKEVEAKKAK